MGESRAERLLRSAEGVAYWAAVAPAVACLPAALGYRIACWRGDWDFRYRHRKRAEVVRNLRQLLGDDLGPDDAERVTRDWFRLASCNAIDVMRLRYRASTITPGILQDKIGFRARSSRQSSAQPKRTSSELLTLPALTAWGSWNLALRAGPWCFPARSNR